MPDTPATVKTVRPQREEAEKTPKEQARADAIDIRCLSLCIGMLERVNGVCFDHCIISRINTDTLLDIRGELYS